MVINAVGRVNLPRRFWVLRRRTPTPATNENLERVSPVEPVIDLSKVFELRIEGKTDEAIDLLRTLNEQHPTSVEVMIQLARSLLDAKQFSLAAFRFEQALSLKSDAQLSKEAAEAHYLSQDFDSAIERYRQYLSTSPEDPSSQLRFARLLADKGKDTEAINAFSKESQNATSDDCLIMGNLFLRKNLLPRQSIGIPNRPVELMSPLFNLFLGY